METIPQEELHDALRRRLDGWELDDAAIRRDFRFDSFPAAIAFINRVATLAEAENHHPELRNVYAEVTVLLTSHDAGGVTEKDLDLAERIEGVVTT